MNSPKCMYEVERPWDASGAEDGGWKDAVYETGKGKRNNFRYEWKEIPTSLIISVGPLKLTETRWCCALFPIVDQRVTSARRTSIVDFLARSSFYLECFNTNRSVVMKDYFTRFTLDELKATNLLEFGENKSFEELWSMAY